MIMNNGVIESFCQDLKSVEMPMIDYGKLTLEQFNELLLKDFPDIYKNQDNDHGFCGIETGPGWHKIIYTLSKDIQNTIHYWSKEKVGEFYVVQIKEKFGTLRFYTSMSDRFIDLSIKEAEFLSSITCEKCGSEVQTGFTSGWLRCLCHKCFLKEEKIRWHQTTILNNIPDTYLCFQSKDYRYDSYVFCLDWDLKTINKVFRVKANKIKPRKIYYHQDYYCKLQKPPRKILKAMKLMGFIINPKAWEIIKNG